MEALDLLLPFLPPRATAVLSLVGAGGKTSLAYALAESAKARGLRVLVTTTTRMWDPRQEGRRLDGFFPWESLAAGGGGGPAGAGRIDVCFARTIEAGPESQGALTRKLLGLDPGQPRLFRKDYDLILVEADGSRGRPIKAPGAHEPVLAEGSDAVLGLVGLDALGSEATEGGVHRLEAFLALTGLGHGDAIDSGSLARLALDPEGLFKNSPAGAARIMVLSKADLVEGSRAEELVRRLASAGCADAIVAAARGHVLYCSTQDR